MLKKLITVSFSLLFLFCLSNVFAQTASNGIDKGMPFVVNPNPHFIQPGSDVPVEEVIASNQNGFSAGPRTRGNIFECTTNNFLVEHRLYLNPTAQTQMMFVVYEGMAATGIFDAISMVDVSPQGPGEGWYSSGSIVVPLIAGRHYMLVAGFEQVTGYWNEQNITPFPIPVAFGNVTAGAGWNWAPGGLVYPPASQENVPSTAYGDPVAYYQTIVTDLEIPVELMSFTYLMDGNDVVINWVTATETNNKGFELQRKADGEYETIHYANGYGTTTERQAYTYTDKNVNPGNYTYRLKQIDLDGSVYYYDEIYVEVQPPAEFSLAQNYPNPFNPSTKIEFNLAVDSRVQLTVYSLLGEEVATLVNADLSAGTHTFDFDAVNLNSGIYFYRIDAKGINGKEFSSVKKMTLTK